jgi:hypothetical protein
MLETYVFPASHISKLCKRAFTKELQRFAGKNFPEDV